LSIDSIKPSGDLNSIVLVCQQPSCISSSISVPLKGFKV
jgi:hypothetical protein